MQSEKDKLKSLRLDDSVGLQRAYTSGQRFLRSQCVKQGVLMLHPESKGIEHSSKNVRESVRRVQNPVLPSSGNSKE